MAASRLDTLLSTEPSPKNSFEILTLINEARLNRPDLILEHGESALKHHAATTKQHWDVIERITLAAAQLGEEEIKETHLDKIMKKFPSSVRAFTLLGMTQEALGGHTHAAETYLSVLRKQPIAPNIYKRQVALLKASKQPAEAASLLNYYLGFHGDDFDAWAELCALALRLGRFSHAAFAANEMILLQPENYAAHLVVADVYMTTGHVEALIMARTHYATSLGLRKSGNLRALYGLWLSCSVLFGDGDLKAQERDKCFDLLSIAKKGIRSVYENHNAAATGEFVMNMLKSNVVTGSKKRKEC